MDKPALVKWANSLGLSGINVSDYVDDLKDAGTCCHRMLELDCLGMSDPTRHEDMGNFTANQIDMAMNGYLKFLDWKKEVGFIPNLNEIQLVHEALKFGGTIDAIGIMHNRESRKVLLDFKTSKGVFGEHKTQVFGGYTLLADFNNYGYDEVIILRVGRNPDEGFEEIRTTPTEILNHQNRFKICRELYEANKLCNKW